MKNTSPTPRHTNVKTLITSIVSYAMPAAQVILITLAVASMSHARPAPASETGSAATCNACPAPLIEHQTFTNQAEPQQASTSDLKPGQPVERELKGGEAHTYRVALAAGEYVKVSVGQKSIDVVVRVFGPDGQKLTEVDNAGGTETVFAVAESPGEFRVEVQPSDKEAHAGVYEIRVEELRAATDKDRLAVAAEKLLEEGDQLRDQRTAESRRKAILKYEEALPLWRDAGEKTGEAQTFNEMGVAYSGLGEPKRAVEFYSQAMPLWRALGDRTNEAITLTNMGTAYWRFGESQKALDSHGQALRLARAAGEKQIEALTLSNTGSVYWSLGQPQEALKYFNQALSIFQTLGNQRLQAVTINNIATAYQQLGELQKALESLTQSIALRRALGDRQGEGTTLTNLGLLYMQLGDLQRSSEHYNQALEIRRASGDRQGEATILEGLSIVYLRLGETEQALKCAEEALALSRSVGDRFLEAYVLVIVGKVYQLSGEPKKALDSFEQSLSLRRVVGDRFGETYTLTNIGNSYLDLGDQTKAVEYYSQSLKLSRDIGDRLGEATTLYWLARASSKAGDNNSARTQIESALTIIESTRTKVASQDYRSSFLASYQGYYEFFVDLLMRMHQGEPSAGYDDAALQASERARARGLLETLTEARVDIREGVDAVLLERERSLQQQLNFKAERLTRLQSGKHTEEQEVAAKKEVESLLAEYKDVEAQIRVKSPHYTALTQPQPLSLKEVQQLLDGGTVLLEYALGEERSYVWAVTPTSIESYTLPKRSEVDAQARRVYESLTARNNVVRFEKPEQRRARIAQADADYLEAATTLSRMVLGPVGKRLEKKRLLIVSDGALQYVPFGALPTLGAVGSGSSGAGRRVGNYRPVIVEHEIVTLPSASTLSVLRKEMADRRRSSKAVAVLADPVFEPDDPRVKRKQTGGQEQAGELTGKTDGAVALDVSLERSARDVAQAEFLRLPHTRQEADAIAALAPKTTGKELLDFEANRSEVVNAELNDYRVIHFATHGLLNSEHPELSGIVLSLVDEEGAQQNGFLRLNEIYNLKLGADLVVMSACRTALGKEIKGEGLIGLTRGFMYAGAPRVVASLWAVDDETTVELMKDFYREMLVGRQRPAAALRAAQVAVWRRKRLPPYYWAAFVLQGEWK
jgi:CHAT domain-containing protein/tetratricopeptide (TPR) repeat protein